MCVSAFIFGGVPIVEKCWQNSSQQMALCKAPETPPSSGFRQLNLMGNIGLNGQAGKDRLIVNLDGQPHCSRARYREQINFKDICFRYTIHLLTISCSS